MLGIPKWTNCVGHGRILVYSHTFNLATGLSVQPRMQQPSMSQSTAFHSSLLHTTPGQGALALALCLQERGNHAGDRSTNVSTPIAHKDLRSPKRNSLHLTSPQLTSLTHAAIPPHTANELFNQAADIAPIAAV